MAGSQEGESVPTLRTRAAMHGVKSGSSSMAWSMVGQAPAEKSVLATMSMEMKLVMIGSGGIGNGAWREGAMPSNPIGFEFR